MMRLKILYICFKVFFISSMVWFTFYISIGYEIQNIKSNIKYYFLDYMCKTEQSGRQNGKRKIEGLINDGIFGTE